jgi:hypothetical protein
MFRASSTTFRRLLQEWNEAGVLEQLHEAVLAELRAAARSGHALSKGTSPGPPQSTTGAAAGEADWNSGVARMSAILN